MEKLIYLVWDRPSRPGADVRAQLLDDIAPRLLACSPRGLQMDLDDDTAEVQSMVAIPGDELPVRALRVDLGRRATTRAAQYEEILAEAGIRRAGYLVTESLYRDYGDNEHAAPRDWPDGQRSPGIVTLSVFDKPAGRERRGVLRPLVRPPVADVGVDAAARALRAQRGRARGSRRARRATARSSRRRGRRPSTSPTSTTFFGADRPATSSGERIRIMLDSTKLLYNPDTMRNYTLSRIPPQDAHHRSQPASVRRAYGCLLTPVRSGSGELGGFVGEEALEVGVQVGAPARVVREVHELVGILGEVVPLVFLVGEVGVDVVELAAGVLAPQPGAGLAAADAVVARAYLVRPSKKPRIA